MSHCHDKIVPGLISGNDVCKVREAVCIQVEKIYDSCRERDCIEDARVIFKHDVQHIVDAAINVKVRDAEVVDVYANIEEVPFKRGFFTVDVKFFIRVTLDFFVPNNGGFDIVTRRGLIVFDKKVILFGSEGNVKIFKSHFVDHCDCHRHKEEPIASRLQQDNLPTAKIEVAEPIALNAKIQDILDKCFEDCCCIDQFPRNVVETLGPDEDVEDRGHNSIPRRRVVVTVGLFSIIKLVRLVQLLIPAFDFCFPNKECIAATDENPCELFETIEFPFDEFFPPQKFDFPGALEAEKRMQEGLSDQGC
jgi:hypothetical protein